MLPSEPPRPQDSAQTDVENAGNVAKATEQSRKLRYSGTFGGAKSVLTLSDLPPDVADILKPFDLDGCEPAPNAGLIPRRSGQ